MVRYNLTPVRAATFKDSRQELVKMWRKGDPRALLAGA